MFIYYNTYYAFCFAPGSKEEAEDVKQCYIKCKGNIEKMLEYLLLASDDRLPVYYDIIDEAIAADELPTFKAYKKLSAAKLKKRKTEVLHNTPFYINSSNFSQNFNE